MYTLTKEEIGYRLKQIRLFLSITQTELKDILNCNQVSISRMESGQGVSWELFIKTLCYYSSYIYIDVIFQEKFQIISIDDKDQEFFKSNVNSMANNIIEEAIHDYQNNISDLSKEVSVTFSEKMDEINQELKNKIEKATNLLSSN